MFTAFLWVRAFVCLVAVGACRFFVFFDVFQCSNGYNAGWQGRVGPGMLSANVMQPKRGSRAAQVQYEIPFAQGGSVSAYDPSRVDAIVNQFM